MPPKSRFESWLNGVIEAGWLAALVIAPLFFNVFSSRVFEPDKISLIRSIALIMLLAWLVKLVETGRGWLPAYLGGAAEAATAGGDASPRQPWWQFWRVPLLLPIALMIVAYAISTTFSVARFVSWWGSYQRLQGTYTFVSYIIIALLAMAHLRTPAQIRRIQHAIIVTSLPIAIYGILQHYDIDPLPWGGDVQTRVAGNAGNAIFLAAYLIMAVFLTLERVYSSFAFLLSSKPNADDSQDMPTALAGGFYLFVLLVQFLTIIWTQSRGPWLGLFLGLYLVAAAALHCAATEISPRSDDRVGLPRRGGRVAPGVDEHDALLLRVACRAVFGSDLWAIGYTSGPKRHGQSAHVNLGGRGRIGATAHTAYLPGRFHRRTQRGAPLDRLWARGDVGGVQPLLPAGPGPRRIAQCQPGPFTQ